MSDKTSVLRGPKDQVVKTRRWARTMTTGTLVATLPKGSRLLALIVGGVASDATVSATISVGTTATATELAAGTSVLTTSGVGPTSLAMVSGKYGTVFTTDQPIYVKYAESGTASTVGGGFVSIHYSTGNLIDDDSI